MRILVTGGSGELGSELLRLAAAAGHEAAGTCLTRAGAGLLPLDVRDEAAVDALVARLAPGLVVHTAYVQVPDGEVMRAVNAGGSVNVARAAARHGARLVHLSSDLVFDGRKGEPYAEDDPLCPLTPYGATKAAAEEELAAACPNALIVRTSLLYGSPQARHRRAALAPGATFFTDELRNPTHTGDLAAAILDLAAAGRPGPVHLVGADAVSRFEFACLLAGRDDLRGAPAPPGRPLDCRLRPTVALRGVREILGAA